MNLQGTCLCLMYLKRKKFNPHAAWPTDNAQKVGEGARAWEVCRVVQVQEKYVNVT